jgi:hypothetical protein
LALRKRGNRIMGHGFSCRSLASYVTRTLIHEHLGMKILQKSFLSIHNLRHFQSRHVCCPYTRYPVLSVVK